VRDEGELPDASFLVLALLAEGKAHGYEIQRMAHDRGFRFWTRLRRSSVYKALESLERGGLIKAQLEPGEGGPSRKVFSTTRRGRARLLREGLRHLSRPDHPRSEIDLGIYALPFLSGEKVEAAVADCLRFLRAREAFLEERTRWCRQRELTLPALAFERPLLCLQAEIRWMERVAETLPTLAQPQTAAGWQGYEFEDPAYIGKTKP